MELLIVTGMSGAGKSQAANALEDIGFYCVDNIPPAIIPSFVELSARSGDLLNKMAIVTDMRGGALFSEIDGVLGNLKRNNIEYKILFLDAADDVLIRRYKENRRKHPLADGNNMSVAAAIAKEREMLKKNPLFGGLCGRYKPHFNSAAKGSAFKYFLRQREQCFKNSVQVLWV